MARNRPDYGLSAKRRPAAIGPFVGMRDSLDPSSSEPNLARLLRNVYPLEPHHRSRVVGRPGVTSVGAQLGGGGDVQLIQQFTELDGTEHSIAIVGGQFYTLNHTTDVWTETLTAANLSAASITLSATARVYAVVFAGQIVFSDGINTPWMWDGTAGAGLTSLTNAPVAFGAPTVYYGKLFFIVAANRAEFRWSEEAQANVGYDQGGYNNAWILRQTDTNRLVRLLGSNESLYVFRERSITEIYGEVNANFSSTGTRESVSSTIGTCAPASVIFANNYVVFADCDGQIHALAPGGEPIPLFENFHETLEGMDSTRYDEIEGYWDPQLELLVFAYQELGQTERSRQLCYHFEGGHLPEPACVFDGYTFTRVGVFKDEDGNPQIFHGSTDGYVYEHGGPEGTLWQDELVAGTQPILHEVVTNLVGVNASMQYHFDRVDMLMLLRTNVDVTVRSESNTGESAALVATMTSGQARWDEAIWDQDSWSGVPVQHLAVGINEFGPYCGLRISHENAAERFGFIYGEIWGRTLHPYAGMA